MSWAENDRLVLLSDSQTEASFRCCGLVATDSTQDGASENESLADADFHSYYRGNEDQADGSSGLYCLRGTHSHSNNRKGGPDDGTAYSYGQVGKGGQTHQAPNEHYRTANSIDEAEQNGQEVQL